MSAPEAVNLGLVTAAYGADEFDAELGALVTRLGGGSVDALVETKLAINDATLAELGQAFARERAGQIRLTTSDGFRDAVTAFAAARAVNRGRSEESK